MLFLVVFIVAVPQFGSIGCRGNTIICITIGDIFSFFRGSVVFIRKNGVSGKLQLIKAFLQHAPVRQLALVRADIPAHPLLCGFLCASLLDCPQYADNHYILELIFASALDIDVLKNRFRRYTDPAYLGFTGIYFEQLVQPGLLPLGESLVPHLP